jgi:hypothetical protein
VPNQNYQNMRIHSPKSDPFTINKFKCLVDINNQNSGSGEHNNGKGKAKLVEKFYKDKNDPTYSD